MQVKAKKVVYYGNKRRREGEVFTLVARKGKRLDKKTGKLVEAVISAEEQFSEESMERLDAPKAKPAPKGKPESPDAK